MSIIKDGKNYGVETKIEIKDEFRDQLFSQTLEEIHSTTPVKYGRNWFYNQLNLKIADIVLSNKVDHYQYENMFNGCTSLTQAPIILPAISLGRNCYADMFNGCTSLAQAPIILPATSLGYECYYNMFYGCTSLTTAPELPAETLADSCYQYMFYNCTSLTTAPDLPAKTLVSNCYQGMFYKCTSLTETPDLPATKLVSNCYGYMFYGCTSLQKTGIISATGNISGYMVNNMFQNCTSLKEMTWTATTPPTITSSMWANCPADMIIYVPDASVDQYKAASVWSSRAEYIKGISEKPTE